MVHRSRELQQFARYAAAFTVVGLLLYVCLYAAAEHVIYQHAKRNRFYMVKTAPHVNYDYVILGASHAAALDYEDMTARLEQMTGSRILNLSVVGGGITINRLLLEYVLVEHRPAAVIYIIDSFVFNSRAWNEDRLRDTRLFSRAPWDPALAWILLRTQASRPVAVDYISGFSRINNPDRFEPDISEEESTRFHRTYRPVMQIDQQRIDYLYPQRQDASALREHYLAEFDELIRYAKSRHVRFMVIKPPIPQRIYRRIPGERDFDAALTSLLQRQEVEFHDFSLVDNDDKFFYDTDHLNRSGVLNFFDHRLKGLLTR